MHAYNRTCDPHTFAHRQTCTCLKTCVHTCARISLHGCTDVSARSCIYLTAAIVNTHSEQMPCFCHDNDETDDNGAEGDVKCPYDSDLFYCCCLWLIFPALPFDEYCSFPAASRMTLPCCLCSVPDGSSDPCSHSCCFNCCPTYYAYTTCTPRSHFVPHYRYLFLCMSLPL